jgi:hypothetical protein
VTIYKVVNPPTAGGTGNFGLRSMLGANIIDENLVFATIGVSTPIGSLTSASVSIDPTQQTAGSLAKYSFSFKIANDIPEGSYFVFYIPNSGLYISPNPSCQAFSINDFMIAGNLKCTYINNIVYVYGLGQTVASGTLIGIQVSMVNPPYSGTTGSFSILIYKQNTQIVFSRATGIPGVQIKAGPITAVSLSLVNPNITITKSKVVDLRMKFLPKNQLATGTIIRLEFPTNVVVQYNILQPYVESGLEDISEANPLILSATAKYITLQNYAPMTVPTQVSVIFRATMPPDFGQTTPIGVRTYTDQYASIIIDENLADGSVYVNNVSLSSAMSIVFSTTISSGGYVDLNFQVTALTNWPNATVFTLVVPQGFVINSLDSKHLSLHEFIPLA